MFYGFEEYFFAGPKPQTLPQHQNILNPFDTSTWLIQGLCVVLISLTFIALQKKPKVCTVLYLFTFYICASYEYYML